MKTIIFTTALVLGFALSSQAAMDKDRGGANGYDGLPLESYIKDPKTLPAYQNIIKPLQEHLRNSLFVDQYFNYVLTHKTWYFVGNLYQTLPPEKIGSAVPTDQIALQDFESVWMDQNRFTDPKMTELDQAKVILHEILMGIKLLRLQSQKEQCLAIITNPINAYQCDEHFSTRIGTPSQLTPTDYNEIRQTVVDFLNFPKDVDGAMVQDLLSRRHFSNQVFPFEGIGTARGLDGETIHQALKDAFLSGNWPQYLYSFPSFYKAHPEIKTGEDITSAITWKPKGACSLDMIEGSGKVVSFHYKSTYAPTLKFDFDLGRSDFFLFGNDVENKLNRSQRTYPIWAYSTDIDKLKVGEHFFSLQFLADENQQIEGVHIYEYVITSVNDGKAFALVRNGVNEICSLKQKLVLKP